MFLKHMGKIFRVSCEFFLNFRIATFTTITGLLFNLQVMSIFIFETAVYGVRWDLHLSLSRYVLDVCFSDEGLHNKK